MPFELTEAERKLWSISTVEEVREIFKKRKHDAEKKKEDLRQFVGIRYRVLIDCADSIIGMQRLNKAALNKLLHIYDDFQTLNNIKCFTPADDFQINETDENKLDDVSGFVKMLITAPERMWSEMDKHCYPKACSQYLEVTGKYKKIMKKIEQKQKCQKNNQNDRTLKDYPTNLQVVLKEHYSTIQQFPKLLIKDCKRRLLVSNMCLQEYTDALLSITILQQAPYSLLQSLDLFLQMRLKWIERILNAARRAFTCTSNNEKYDNNARNEDQSVEKNPYVAILKHVFEFIITAIQLTICQSCILFPAYQPSVVLQCPIESELSLRDQIHSFFQSINVVTEQPTSPLIQALSKTTIQEYGQKWLSSCIDLLNKSLPRFLNMLGNGSELGTVRDIVLSSILGGQKRAKVAKHQHLEIGKNCIGVEKEKLKQDHKQEKQVVREEIEIDQTSAEKKEQTLLNRISIWKQDCLAVIGRPVNLWGEIFLNHFLLRSKELVNTSFTNLTLNITIKKSKNMGLKGKQKMKNPFVMRVLPKNFISNKRRDQLTSLRCKVTNKLSAHDLLTADSTLGRYDDLGHGVQGLLSEDVAIVCNQFNRQMSNLIEDTQHLLYIKHCSYLAEILSLNCPTKGQSIKLKKRDSSNKNRSACHHEVWQTFKSVRKMIMDVIRPFVRKKCTIAISNIVNNLKKKINRLQSQILDIDEMDNIDELNDQNEKNTTRVIKLIEKAAFIGKICGRLLHSSTVLKRITSLDNPDSGSISQYRDETYDYVQQSILETARSGYTVWTRWMAANLGEDLNSDLKNWFHQWQTDDSQKIIWPAVESESFLSLPGKPSPYIYNFLFSLVKEISRIEGYEVCEDVLSWVIPDVLNCIIRIYSVYIEGESFSLDDSISINKSNTSLTTLTDAGCFQLLFDLKFLFAVLRLPTDTKNEGKSIHVDTIKKNFSNVLSKVEQRIDPIDLSLAVKTIHARIRHLLPHVHVLFGAFIEYNPFPLPDYVVRGVDEKNINRAFALSNEPYQQNVELLEKTNDMFPMVTLPSDLKCITPLHTSIYPVKKIDPPPSHENDNHVDVAENPKKNIINKRGISIAAGIEKHLADLSSSFGGTDRARKLASAFSSDVVSSFGASTFSSDVVSSFGGAERARKLASSFKNDVRDQTSEMFGLFSSNLQNSHEILSSTVQEWLVPEGILASPKKKMTK